MLFVLRNFHGNNARRECKVSMLLIGRWLCGELWLDGLTVTYHLACGLVWLQVIVLVRLIKVCSTPGVLCSLFKFFLSLSDTVAVQ